MPQYNIKKYVKRHIEITDAPLSQFNFIQLQELIEIKNKFPDSIVAQGAKEELIKRWN